jgi:dTDP-4-amino-4,6-dideoxygalactose transaminase
VGTPAAATPCPIANTLSDEVMSLPIGPHMNDAQVDRVCDVLLAALAN